MLGLSLPKCGGTDEDKRVRVDHATIQRWVFKFSPELDRQMRKSKEGSWNELANG